MNIHINRLVNNKLDNSEIRINIEYAEKNEDIKNLINHIQEYDKRKMVVFDGYNMIQINTEEIIYFYSDGNYNFCKTKEKEYRIKSKLYEIEKKSNDFLRISKSCIVNIKQVKSFDIGENRNIIVRFFDNSKQYVSRRKIKEVIIEFLIGIFIFNFIFSICKTLKLINIGAKNESFIENIKISFSETFLIYIIIYAILVIIQVIYDRHIVNKLNEKLKKQKKGGNENEQ